MDHAARFAVDQAVELERQLVASGRQRARQIEAEGLLLLVDARRQLDLANVAAGQAGRVGSSRGNKLKEFSIILRKSLKFSLEPPLCRDTR